MGPGDDVVNEFGYLVNASTPALSTEWVLPQIRLSEPGPFGAQLPVTLFRPLELNLGRSGRVTLEGWIVAQGSGAVLRDR